MKNEKHHLEKIIKEQEKQINSLKKAVAILEQRLSVVMKKASRAYEQSRKNSNDINNITTKLRRH